MGIRDTLRRRSWVYIGLLTLLIVLLAACGTKAGTTTGAGGSGGTASQTPAPTSVKGYGTEHGCPSDMVITTAPGKANITLQLAKANSTITARPGNIVEVQLPFGKKWSGPTSSQGVLELQGPAGYASKSDTMCIWRFVAKSAGSTTLAFKGQAICKPNQMCPMYIMNVPFTIDVK